jgi:aminopeptidase-like protein
MANDNLSGLLLTCFLARHIVRHLTNKFTYRFVFVPETIGSIAYLSQRLDQNYSDIELGIVVTTVGGPGVYGYKQSYNQNHYINSIVEDTFHNLSVPFITYPFDIHGSDERQYSAPPYSINTISITRDKYYEYPYYHTSLDNLDFVKGSQINDSLQIYIQLIQNLEALDYPSRNFEACEPFLSKHGLYSSVGGSLIPNTKEYTSTDIILWLLFLSDGKTPTYSIAKILNLPLPLITEFVNMLRSKGILG